MLGIINLKNKNDLEKLSKEELIDLLAGQAKGLEELLLKIINYTEEELIAYQKEIKFFRGLAKMFGL